MSSKTAAEANLYLPELHQKQHIYILELQLKQAYVAYLPELHHRSKLIFPGTAHEASLFISPGTDS